MLNFMIEGIQKMLKRIEEPQTYGSELESYIVANNPQSTYDVEELARRYQERTYRRGWLQ